MENKSVKTNQIFCPVCNGIKYWDEKLERINNKKFKFLIVFCNKCKTGLRFPNLNTEEAEQFYPSGFNLSNYHNDLEKTFQAMMKISEYRFQYIYRLFGFIPPKYLEIGPGAGTLITLFKNKGSNVTGIEPDKITADWLIAKKGLMIYNQFFKDFVKSKNFLLNKGKYDIIAVCHVLEHIPQPVEFLENIKMLTNSKTGMLYIEVPNIYKPYFDGIKWKDYCYPGHLFYYSSSTLRQLLEQSGFKIIELTDDEFPPYYPISCMVKCSKKKSQINELILDDTKKIRNIWLWYKLRHNLFYFPKRYLTMIVKKVLSFLYR